jgi:hypothetical protein
MPPRPTPAPVRFWRRVKLAPANECWPWLGASMELQGYGVFCLRRGKTVLAHRFAYQEVRGIEIPAKMQVDHLCRVRLCVNPIHLEAVTQRENLRRGMGFAGVNARKPTCPEGHPYDWMYLRADGKDDRRCSQCCPPYGNYVMLPEGE